MSQLGPWIKGFRALAKALDAHSAQPAHHEFATSLGAAADDLEQQERAACTMPAGTRYQPPADQRRGK